MTGGFFQADAKPGSCHHNGIGGNLNSSFERTFFHCSSTSMITEQLGLIETTLPHAHRNFLRIWPTDIVCIFRISLASTRRLAVLWVCWASAHSDCHHSSFTCQLLRPLQLAGYITYGSAIFVIPDDYTFPELRELRTARHFAWDCLYCCCPHAT